MAWDIATGKTVQLTNLRSTWSSLLQRQQVKSVDVRWWIWWWQCRHTTSASNANQRKDWLKNDQLREFSVDAREKKAAYNKSLPKAKDHAARSMEDKQPKAIFL